MYTPERYAAFEQLSQAVRAELGVPPSRWSGSIVELEQLINTVRPPPESDEEREARLKVRVTTPQVNCRRARPSCAAAVPLGGHVANSFPPVSNISSGFDCERWICGVALCR